MKECMKRRKFAGRINRNGENPGEIVVIQDSLAASDPLPFRMGDAPYSFLRVKCTGFLDLPRGCRSLRRFAELAPLQGIWCTLSMADLLVQLQQNMFS